MIIIIIMMMMRFLLNSLAYPIGICYVVMKISITNPDKIIYLKYNLYYVRGNLRLI